ncbi:FtsQ-type POTRA domain-containing protein [bacterium]|nr:FtsQ-type POTRA domain-containing protein [bacterium]
MSRSIIKKDEILASLVKLIYTGAALCIIYFAGRGYLHWLDQSPLFKIESIKITGSNYLSDEEILSLSGLDKAKKIWDARLEDAVNSIKTYPFIEDVSVIRRLPDKIEIKVKEKEPIALLNFQGDLYSIDRHGLVLPTIPGKMYNLPVISGNFKGGLKVGIEIGGGIAKQGLSVITAIIRQKPSLYTNISEVVLKSGGQVVLFTRNRGIPVKMGRKEISRKITYLDAILGELKRDRSLSKVNYIDLRFRGQVVVGMRV